MNVNPIGIAVPFFFALLGLEVVLAHRAGKRLHRMNDSIADLTCGMGDQILAVFTTALTVAAYLAIYENFRFAEMPQGAVWTWVVGLFAVDFSYYWYHRFGHRVNIGWAAHVVHHQSEEYNLAVALRQPWFSKIYSWTFYLPWALLGLPPIVYLTTYSLNLLYQFWIHTRLIDRMGPVEWVMNTPSHHRVHHGINDCYLDKNYAGIFIIWDRMFGTFELEDEEVLYGTRRPVRRWDPFWNNIEPWVYVARMSAAADTLGETIWAWFAPPEWTPTGHSEFAHTVYPPPGRGFDDDAPKGLHKYVLLHLVPVGLTMTWMLTFDASLPTSVLTLCSVVIVWTAIGWAGLFEGRRWVLPVEWGRHLGLAGLALWLLTASLGGPWPAVGGALLVFALGSGLWLFRVGHRLQPAAKT